MNCRNVQQSLSAYIDRELTGREMLLIRSHVLQCACCAQEEEDIRRLKGLLSSVPTVEPPCGFEERLLSSLAEGNKPSSQRGFGLPLLSMVALCSTGLTLLLLHSSDRPPQERPVQSFQVTTSRPDVAYGVRLDQASAMNHDPLSGGVIFVANERR